MWTDEEKVPDLCRSGANNLGQGGEGSSDAGEAGSAVSDWKLVDSSTTVGGKGARKVRPVVVSETETDVARQSGDTENFMSDAESLRVGNLKVLLRISRSSFAEPGWRKSVST